VRDFFDRIHFFIELPGARAVGQAIAQVLSSIAEFSHRKDAGIVSIERNLLLAIAATDWPSVRAIKTMCRIALATAHPDDGVFRMRDFALADGLGGFREMHELVSEASVYADTDLVTIKEWVKDEALAK
jgi:hypothetical protein